jgi:methyl-accepting chemotaxis protein
LKLNFTYAAFMAVLAACPTGAMAEVYSCEISENAQLAAQGNETLVANIGSLSDAIGETNKTATSVLAASSALTSTAETLSREVDKFFSNLRADPLDRQSDDVRRTGTTG